MNVELKNTRFGHASVLGTLVIDDKDISLIYTAAHAKKVKNTSAEIQ